MKDMYRLKEMLCAEVDEIQNKGELSAGDLETLHKLTDTIKNIGKIEMIEEGGYSEDGYSRDGDWEARGRFGHGHSYDGGGSYDGGSSYDRGQSYRRGKHYVRGHYSRDDGKEGMIRNLTDMMKKADGREREAIRRALEEIKAG